MEVKEFSGHLIWKIRGEVPADPGQSGQKESKTRPVGQKLWVEAEASEQRTMWAEKKPREKRSPNQTRDDVVKKWL